MIQRVLQRLIAAVIIMAATFALASITHAQRAAVVATQLTLQVDVDEPGGGERTPIVSRLTTASGQPIADARIVFLVNGQRDGEARTDPNGYAAWRIRRELPAGSYTITAVFGGIARRLLPSSAALPLVMQATQIEIQTVASPAVPAGAPAAQSTSGTASGPLRVGMPITAIAHLTTTAGEPVVNGRVEFFINGVRDGEARTDTTGKASWRLGRDFSTGDYTIEAAFPGLPTRLPIRATAPLVIAPALLELQTVPRLPGARFALNDRPFEAGSDGIARIEVARAGTYWLTVLPWNSPQPDVRAVFTRWSDDLFMPEREVTIPQTKPLQVGYNLSYLVRHTFVDLTGQRIDPSYVSNVNLEIVSSQGVYHSFDTGQAQWLQGTRIARLEHGLEEREVLYSLESVMVNGSNVVNQAQQRLAPSTQREWQIRLMFYTVEFKARDALFGSPLGSGIELEFPDGQIKTVAFADDATGATLSLPRGSYRVRVQSSGISPFRPLSLSRNQQIDLNVISPLDLTLVLGALIGLALGLLWVGRPHVRNIVPIASLWHKRRSQPRTL